LGSIPAHDPPKCERFGDEIMRLFNNLERDLWTNEDVCPARPDSTFADRALVGYMLDRYTAFKKHGRPEHLEKTP
jgi:hypothetical protein